MVHLCALNAWPWSKARAQRLCDGSALENGSLYQLGLFPKDLPDKSELIEPRIGRQLAGVKETEQRQTFEEELNASFSMLQHFVFLLGHFLHGDMVGGIVSWRCHKKYHRLSGIKQQNVFFHNSGG